WRSPKLNEPAQSPHSAWFSDRSSLPPVPPTQPALLGPNPVVVLVTIDALRADAIEDAANEPQLPTFKDLKRRGAYFARTTSPGSQTAVSLTAVFSGRYFSQLYWTMHGSGTSRFAYAADDPWPRFPQLLTQHGVATA